MGATPGSGKDGVADCGRESHETCFAGTGGGQILAVDENNLDLRVFAHHSRNPPINRARPVEIEATYDTWKTSNFTIALHQKSRYPLTGAHLAIACNECHKPMAGSPVALYHFKTVACTTCHEDIHHGEFTNRMAAISAPAGNPAGCEACHQTKDWHEMSKFDHSTTKFALDGSHRAVQCNECHKPPNLERTMVHVNFADAPVACNQCHQNPHADQFGPRVLKCAECHNT